MQLQEQEQTIEEQFRQEICDFNLIKNDKRKKREKSENILQICNGTGNSEYSRICFYYQLYSF